MADNIASTKVPESTTSVGTFATDDIAGVHYPRSKVVWGVDGTATDCSNDNPMPVTGVLTGDALTSLQLIDDTVVVLGTATYTEASSKGLAIGAVRRDADTTLVNTTNEFGPLQMNAAGQLKVEVFDGGDSHTVDNGGTFPVQAEGRAAHDAVASGNPVLIGGVASNSSPLSVSDGDAVQAWYSNAGAATVRIVNDNGGLAQTGFGIPVVQDGTGWSVTVASGAITETNSTAMAASLAAIDDWDESDRAKVNLIVGQAGVQGASGAVSANTQRVVLATDVALPAGTNAIGKLAANSGVDIGDVDITSIAAGDNNIGNVDIVTVPTDPFGANADAGSATGSISAKLRFIASTGIPITGTVTVGSHAVTNAGTFVVQVDGTALTRLTDIETNTDSGAVVGNGAAATAQRVTIANDSTGILAGVTTVTTVTTCSTVTTLAGSSIAHDGVDSGNPHKIGMRALAHGTNPTAVAAADRTDWLANRHGVPWVIGGHPNVVTLKHTTITTAVTDAAIITISTGSKIVVTRITATLDSASTVYPSVLIGFGTANTPTTTGVIAAHGGVPAGGGFNVGDGSGIVGIGADNEDLRVTTTGNATGNGLQICVSYYTIES